MRKLLLAAAACLLLAGCGTAAVEDVSEPQRSPAPKPTPLIDLGPEPEPEVQIQLPDGYPKVVDLSEVPEQMRWAFEDDGTGQAVAVADGVWAHLTPGATAEDAVNAMVFDGYCASKEAFEREYLGGESTGGSCW